MHACRHDPMIPVVFDQIIISASVHNKMAFSISLLDEEVLILKSMSLCFFRAYVNNEIDFTEEEAGKIE